MFLVLNNFDCTIMYAKDEPRTTVLGKILICRLGGQGSSLPELWEMLLPPPKLPLTLLAL